MCDCQINKHPAFGCGSLLCLCHDDERRLMFEDEKYVYMSITFYKVALSKSHELLEAAMVVAGPGVDVSVHYDQPLEETEDA